MLRFEAYFCYLLNCYFIFCSYVLLSVLNSHLIKNCIKKRKFQYQLYKVLAYTKQKREILTLTFLFLLLFLTKKKNCSIFVILFISTRQETCLVFVAGIFMPVLILHMAVSYPRVEC